MTDKTFSTTQATTASLPAPAGYSSTAIEQERLLTVQETKQRLGVSHVTVYALFNRGALPSLQIGRARRVRLSDLLAFMAGTASA